MIGQWVYRKLVMNAKGEYVELNTCTVFHTLAKAFESLASQGYVLEIAISRRELIFVHKDARC